MFYSDIELRRRKNTRLTGIRISSARAGVLCAFTGYEVFQFILLISGTLSSDLKTNFVETEITLNLEEAACFLKMSPEALRRKAKDSVIPGFKPGKSWVFLKSDLVSFVRSSYACQRQASQGGRKEVLCHFTDAKVSGGSALPLPLEREYVDLLDLEKENRRRNSMTVLRPSAGKSRN